jgi:hypothetical protein
VVWPIDIATITEKDNGYALQRVVTANPADVRGLVKMAPRLMVFVYSCFLGHDGSWWSERRIAGALARRWRPIDVAKTIVKGGAIRSFTYTEESLEQFDVSIGMSFSLALTERYQWHAAFGHENGPRLLIATSSAGAASLFKNREKAPDHSRRAALKHWVQNYYRSSFSNFRLLSGGRTANTIQ